MVKYDDFFGLQLLSEEILHFTKVHFLHFGTVEPVLEIRVVCSNFESMCIECEVWLIASDITKYDPFFYRTVVGLQSPLSSLVVISSPT